MSLELDVANLIQQAKLPQQATDTGLLPDGSLTLLLENVALGQGELLRAELISNYKTVTDPSADHKTFTGTWRTQSVTLLPNGTDIEWQLARRYDTAIDWTQARLVGGREYDTDDDYLIVEWPNLSQATMDAMFTTLKAVSASTITIGGEVYNTATGKDWEILAVLPSWADDGSGIIRAFFGDPTLEYTGFQSYLMPASQEVLYLYNVPKQFVQSTVNTYKQEGNSASVNPGSVEGTMDIVVRKRVTTTVDLTIDGFRLNCTFSSKRIYQWGLSKGQAEDLVAGYTSAVPDGEERSFSLSFNQTADSYDVVIDIRTRDSKAISSLLDDLIRVVPSRTTERILDFRWGIDNVELVEFLSTLQNTEVLSKYISVDGTLSVVDRNMRLSRNDDCTFDVVSTTELKSSDEVEFSTKSDTEEDAQLLKFTLNRTELDEYLATVNDLDTDLGDHDDTLQPAGVPRGARGVTVRRNPDDTYSISVRRSRQKAGEINKSLTVASEDMISWSTGKYENSAGTVLPTRTSIVKGFYGQSYTEVFTLLQAEIPELLGTTGSRDDTAGVDIGNINLNRNSDGTFDVSFRLEVDVSDILVPNDPLQFEDDVKTELNQWAYNTLDPGQLKNRLDVFLGVTPGGTTGTLEPGQIADIRLQRTRDGRYDLSMQKSIPKPQTIGPYISRISNDGSMTELEVKYTSSPNEIPALPGDPIDPAMASSEATTVTRGAGRSVNITRRKDYYAPQIIPYVAGFQNNKRLLGMTFKYLPTPPDPLTELGVAPQVGTDGKERYPDVSMSLSYDSATGTYSGAAVTEDNSSFEDRFNEIWDGTITSPTTIYKVVWKTGTDGARKWARIPITYSTMYADNPADAEAYVNNGLEGSKVEVRGPARFKATFVSDDGMDSLGTVGWTGIPES